MPPVSTTLANLMAKFAAGVADTGGKFAADVVDTGSNFAAGVVDTGGKFATGGAPLLANISGNFRKKFETVQMVYSGAGGKLIHEKTRSKKSLDTVPLKLVNNGKVANVRYWYRTVAIEVCWSFEHVVFM